MPFWSFGQGGAGNLAFPWFYQFIETDASAVTSTTLTTFQTLSLVGIAAGTYLIQGYNETTNDVVGNSVTVETLVDGVVATSSRFGFEVDVIDVLSRGTWRAVVLTAGNHTITMTAVMQTGTGTIRRRRLSALRVA